MESCQDLLQDNIKCATDAAFETSDSSLTTLILMRESNFRRESGYEEG